MHTQLFDIDAEWKAWFGTEEPHRDRNPSSKPKIKTKWNVVVRTDKQGNKTAFKTLYDAAAASGVCVSMISHCLHSRWETAGGYTWTVKPLTEWTDPIQEPQAQC